MKIGIRSRIRMLGGIKTLAIGLFVPAMLLSAININKSSEPQNGVWNAPASADNVKNPLSGNADATAKGKKLFKQMCEICHGKSGKGDGVAGMSLTPRPSNFTLATVQSQSDGAIFWKLTEGRAPMASYKASLKEDQRWQLVNFLRTLKK